MGNDYFDNLTITSMLTAGFLMRCGAHPYGLTQGLCVALLSFISHYHRGVPLRASLHI